MKSRIATAMFALFVAIVAILGLAQLNQPAMAVGQYCHEICRCPCEVDNTCNIVCLIKGGPSTTCNNFCAS
jgi:hypothetical protein